MRRAAVAMMGLMIALVSPASADVITDWNQTAIAAMKAANTGGNPSTRNMAMMHVAMSDAVNAVQNKFAVYAPGGTQMSAASAEAAAAAAARTILLQQLPGQKALIEEAFEASTKSIAEGAPKKDGIAIGEKCAAAVIADRASDGTNAPDAYRPITTPVSGSPRLRPSSPSMPAPSPGS